MARIRLLPRKRGHRWTGSGLWGSVSEGAFFVFMLVLGTASLALVISSRVLGIPWLAPLTVGLGMWLATFVMATIIGIGMGGLVWTVIRTRTSVERRSAVVRDAGRRRHGGSLPTAADFPGIPRRDLLQESPGVHLAFRLPGKMQPIWSLVAGISLCLLWVGLAAVLTSFLLSRWSQGSPGLVWGLALLASVYASIRAIRFFMELLRDTLRVGQSLVEVSDLPLFPGEAYDVFFSQAGRMRLKNLELALVCDEQAIFRDGTSERVERRRVVTQPVHSQGPVRIRPGTPFRRSGMIALDPRVMHSFQSPSNRIEWKLVIHGSFEDQGEFEREFPVVIYPACASLRYPG